MSGTTREEGYVKFFLVVKDEGTSDEYEYFMLFPFLVEELINDNDELATNGRCAPSLSFYTIIQPILVGENVKNDKSWSFAKIGEPERVEGFWQEVKSGLRVYRGNPCVGCGKREWVVKNPNPSIQFLCARCNIETD